MDLSGKSVVGGDVAGGSWQHFTIRYDGQGDCKSPLNCNPGTFGCLILVILLLNF